MNLFKKEPLKFVDDIHIFTKSDFYWGILEREEMMEFLSFVKKNGFQKSLNTFSFSKRFDYAQEPCRSDFIYYLPIDDEKIVLDLGSGYGNISTKIAPYAKRVVAADGSLPLLQFSSLSAKDKNIKNIDFVQIDPLSEGKLPFSDDSFDLVILNGVLEWVAYSSANGDPRDYQKNILKEIYRVLKKDGVVYVGIENRLFPGWIERDPHSKLKYTSILPRFLADWYCRKNGFDNGYRTYIYSLFGYRKLFKESGLHVSDLYISYPNYRLPNYIYKKERDSTRFMFTSGFAKQMYTKKWYAFLKILSYFNMEHIFISSYMFLLTKDKTKKIEQNLFSKLIQNNNMDTTKFSIIKIMNKMQSKVVKFLLLSKNKQTTCPEVIEVELKNFFSKEE